MPDTDAYIEYFDIETSDFNNFTLGFEIGFQALAKIVKLFNDNYKYFFAVITVINLLLISSSVKTIINSFVKSSKDDLLYKISLKSGYTLIPLTLYAAYFGIYYNAIVLRAGIAISLLVFSTSIAIKQRKSVWDKLIIMIILILSYLFHSTSIIGIIVLITLLFLKQYSRKTYLILWLIIGFIYFTNIFQGLGGIVFESILKATSFQSLTGKLGSYTSSHLFNYEARISLKFIFLWISSIILVFSKNIENRIYYKFLNLLFVGIFLMSLFRSVLLVERVTDYFTVFSFISFMLFLYPLKNINFFLFYTMFIIIQLIFSLRITGIYLI